jgi:hypothetical protein
MQAARDFLILSLILSLHLVVVGPNSPPQTRLRSRGGATMVLWGGSSTVTPNFFKTLTNILF